VIHRPYYLDAIKRVRDAEKLVKVVTGVRRCGKSTLLDLYRDHLLGDGVSAQSIGWWNFESMVFAHIQSPEALSDLVVNHTWPPGKRYVFLDEVQLVPGWERAVNSLRLDPRNDVYITGSNGRLLDSELASLLSGRYFPIEVYPLSFKEFCQFSGKPAGSEALFNDYLRTGGLPGQFDLRDDARVRAQYIDAVLNTIITKDIVGLQEVRDVASLLKVVRYLSDNIGNLVTAKGIADYLGSTGNRISGVTVDNYLTLLTQAYLFYRVKREDLKGKAVMKTNDKFMVVDLGFRAVTHGLGTPDLGRLLENVVFFELRRRYSTVSLGKYGAEAVDFVTFDPARGTAYFQVTASMTSPETQERELRPLKALRDSHPKTVLSLDQVRTRDYDGIRHENIIDWLLDPPPA